MRGLAIVLSVVVALASVASLVPTAAQAQGGTTAPAGAAPGGAAAPTGQQTAGPTPRPDLALSLRDLPPGFEQAPSLELMLDDRPLDDRVLRRATPGAGPSWIWTMTYQGNPISQERLDFLADDLAVFLTRALDEVVDLTDWQVQSLSLGAISRVYSFKFRAIDSDLVGDGALALFGPGDYVSYLAVINVDGQSLPDLQNLARIVSTRINAQRTAAPAPR